LIELVISAGRVTSAATATLTTRQPVSFDALRCRVKTLPLNGMAEIIIAKVYGVTRDAIGAIVFLHRPVGTEIDSSTKIRIDSLIFSEDQMAYAFTEHIEIRGSGKALVRYGDSVQLTINPDPAS
jgi:hypothetical protein